MENNQIKELNKRIEDLERQLASGTIFYWRSAVLTPEAIEENRKQTRRIAIRVFTIVPIVILSPLIFAFIISFFIE